MHAKYGSIQREAFRKMHQQLTPSSVVVVQDLIRHYPYTDGISNAVVDMVAFMILLDSNALETIQHMHILSKQHKNNHHFKKQVKQDVLAGNFNPQNPKDYAQAIHRTTKNMQLIELTQSKNINCVDIVKWSKGIREFYSIKYVGFLDRSIYSIETSDCVKQNLW